MLQKVITKIRNLNSKNKKNRFFFEHALIIKACYISNDRV